MKMTDEYRIEKHGDCFRVIKTTNVAIFYDRELAEKFIGSLNQNNGTVDPAVEKEPARNISGPGWSSAEDAILKQYADQIPRPFGTLLKLLPGRTRAGINGRYERMAQKAKRRSSVLHPEIEADTGMPAPPNTESTSEDVAAEVPDKLVATGVVQTSYQGPRRVLAVTGPDSGIPDQPIIVSQDRLRAGR
jgi:hypothetical protein